jgi:hypothetical protein
MSSSNNTNTGGTPRTLFPTPTKEQVPELTDDESSVASGQSVEFESYSDEEASSQVGEGDTAEIVRGDEEPRS